MLVNMTLEVFVLTPPKSIIFTHKTASVSPEFDLLGSLPYALRAKIPGVLETCLLEAKSRALHFLLCWSYSFPCGRIEGQGVRWHTVAWSCCVALRCLGKSFVTYIRVFTLETGDEKQEVLCDGPDCFGQKGWFLHKPHDQVDKTWGN